VSGCRGGVSNPGNTTKLPARRLTDIIDDSRFKDRPIDFLSVDTEGHDYHVLRSLDMDRYRPYVIAFECHADTLEGVEDDRAYQYLVEQGYKMVSWSVLTVFMVDHQAPGAPELITKGLRASKHCAMPPVPS